MIYEILNAFFFVFHTVLVLFNLFGWIFPKTRKLNLVSLLLVAFSWFVLGIRYGWGYCFCTDWHWHVREHLGYFDQSRSYIHFLILKISGINLPEKAVEAGTAACFLACLVISVWLNARDSKRHAHLPEQESR